MPALQKKQLDDLIKIYNQRIGEEKEVSHDALSQEEKAISALLLIATQNNSKATWGAGVLQVYQCLLGNTPGFLEYEERNARGIYTKKAYSDAYALFFENIFKEVLNKTIDPTFLISILIS